MSKRSRNLITFGLLLILLGSYGLLGRHQPIGWFLGIAYGLVIGRGFV